MALAARGGKKNLGVSSWRAPSLLRVELAQSNAFSKKCACLQYLTKLHEDLTFVPPQ